MRDVDLKLFYNQVTFSDQSNGFLINVPSNVFLYANTFHTVSAAVDFIESKIDQQMFRLRPLAGFAI